MRPVFLVLSIVAACTGLVTCGGATCLSLLNFEPPHPHWQLRVSDANAHPERAKVGGIGSVDYAVSIHPGDSQCSLKVKNTDGKVLGSSQGGLCIVKITGHDGDAWSFEATSPAPDAEIQLAFDNPLFPKPLGHVAFGGVVLALVGMLGAVLSSTRPPASRA